MVMHAHRHTILFPRKPLHVFSFKRMQASACERGSETEVLMIVAICRRRTGKQERSRTIWKLKMLFDADLEAMATFNDPQHVRAILRKSLKGCNLNVSILRNSEFPQAGAGDSNRVEREGSVCKTAAITKKIQRWRRAGSAAL